MTLKQQYYAFSRLSEAASKKVQQHTFFMLSQQQSCAVNEVKNLSHLKFHEIEMYSLDFFFAAHREAVRGDEWPA
jgi:hypothetical protein